MTAAFREMASGPRARGRRPLLPPPARARARRGRAGGRNARERVRRGGMPTHKAIPRTARVACPHGRGTGWPAGLARSPPRTSPAPTLLYCVFWAVFSPRVLRPPPPRAAAAAARPRARKPPRALADAARRRVCAGFNVETVEYKNISFTVWDVGGQDKVRARSSRPHGPPALRGVPVGCALWLLAAAGAARLAAPHARAGEVPIGVRHAPVRLLTSSTPPPPSPPRLIPPLPRCTRISPIPPLRWIYFLAAPLFNRPRTAATRAFTRVRARLLRRVADDTANRLMHRAPRPLRRDGPPPLLLPAPSHQHLHFA